MNLNEYIKKKRDGSDEIVIDFENSADSNSIDPQRRFGTLTLRHVDCSECRQRICARHTKHAFTFEQFYTTIVGFVGSCHRLAEISLEICRGAEGKFVCNERHENCRAIRHMLQSIHIDEGSETHLHFRRIPLISSECLQTAFAVNGGGSSLTNKSLYCVDITDGEIYRTAASDLLIGALLPIYIDLIGDVKVLKLQWNCASQSTANQLRLALLDPRCTVETLEVFAYNGDMITLAMAQTLRVCHSAHLRQLTLRNMSATADSIVPLFDALLSSDVRLSSLDLSGNYLTQQCFDKAAEFVASNVCELNWFDLSNVLAQRDKRRRPTAVIDLQSLGRALKNNKTVVVLRLCDVACCGAAGTDVLCDLLLENRTLRYVDFSLNPHLLDVTSLTESPFCNILKCNKTLKELDLVGTLDKHHFGLIVDTLEKENFTLTGLTLSEYDYEDESYSLARDIAARIQAVLERNQSLVWCEELHEALLEFCLSMSALQLPPYVLLEIFDWYPLMEHVNHWDKIQLIFGVDESHCLFRMIGNSQ